LIWRKETRQNYLGGGRYLQAYAWCFKVDLRDFINLPGLTDL